MPRSHNLALEQIFVQAENCGSLENCCPQGLLGSNPGRGVLFLSSVARKPLRADKGRLPLCGNPSLGVSFIKYASLYPPDGNQNP